MTGETIVLATARLTAAEMTDARYQILKLGEKFMRKPAIKTVACAANGNQAHFDEEVVHMEPMVVCALGIVLYYGYLAGKDLVEELRREGLLVSLKQVKALARVRINAAMRFFAVKGMPRHAGRANNSFVYLPAIPYARQHQAAPHMYRARLG
jgi:hypothetical protein